MLPFTRGGRLERIIILLCTCARVRVTWFGDNSGYSYIDQNVRKYRLQTVEIPCSFHPKKTAPRSRIGFECLQCTGWTEFRGTRCTRYGFKKIPSHDFHTAVRSFIFHEIITELWRLSLHYNLTRGLIDASQYNITIGTSMIADFFFFEKKIESKHDSGVRTQVYPVQFVYVFSSTITMINTNRVKDFQSIT